MKCIPPGYQDSVVVETTIRLSLRNRIRVLFGARVRVAAEIYTGRPVGYSKVGALSFEVDGWPRKPRWDDFGRSIVRGE